MTAPRIARNIQRDMYRRMSLAATHPVIGHAISEVTGANNLVALHRFIYEPFAQARRANPYVTMREFLLSDARAADALRRVLGEDQFVLATELTGDAYFAARRRVLAAMRGNRPFVPQWMAWGHWGRQPVDLGDTPEAPRLVPVDFPHFDTTKGAWVYPSWGLAHNRYWWNVAYAELVQRLPPGATIPDDMKNGDLLAQLALTRDPVMRPFTGLADVRMSTLQIAQMLSTGQGPIRMVRATPGSELPPGFKWFTGGSTAGRPAVSARWELAVRRRDPNLVNQGYFDRKTDADLLGPNPTDSIDGDPADPISLLTDAELVAVARNAHGCPEFIYQSFELEHRRAKRSLGIMTRGMRTMRQVVDAHLLAHLCGFADPHNLVIVSPEEHAAADFFAMFTSSRQFERQPQAPNQFKRWAPNNSRIARLQPDPDRPPTPPPTVEPGEPPLEPDEWIGPDRFDYDYDAHPDVARAMNVFIGFSPYHLEPVAHMLRQPSVRATIERLAQAGGEDADRAIGVYNGLAGCINAAMRSYQMDVNLMPRLFQNGRWL